MVSFLPERASVILEVGCGRGGFGQTLRRTFPQATLIGCEPSKEMADDAREAGYDQLFVDVFPGPWGEEIPAPDLIVFNDVLEHMTDPWSVLHHARGMLAPGGSVVVSIPNVRHFSVAGKLLFRGSWEYQEWGILDRTHLRFFTKTSIRELLESSGFVITDMRPLSLSRRGFPYLPMMALGRHGEEWRAMQYGARAQAGF
jgi:predicted TPR repeat methyltransferase